MKIDVLGTEYVIETHKVSEDPALEDGRLADYSFFNFIVV